MLLCPLALKSRNTFGWTFLRMMCASFNGNFCTTMVYCNSHSNVNDETDIATFYHELSFFVGDMKAQIGPDVNDKFCLYKSSKGNRKYLANFWFENWLTYLNKNSKKEWKLWTYTYPNNSKPQLDCRFIKKLTNIAVHSEAYPSFKWLPPDRRIVSAQIGHKK